MNVFIASVLILFVAGVGFCSAGITDEQMEKSFSVVRNVCQPKTKASDDQVAGIRTGNWQGQEQKCYTHCVMELMGVLKRTKVNVDAALKQFNVLLPEGLKQPFINGLNLCKDAGKGVKDTCEVGFMITKCFQENIAGFVFP